MTSLDRSQGCLAGLAVGVALGTTLEFRAPGSFKPLTDIVGGGPFQLKAGQWTDDTSMALCLTESLIEFVGFDLRDPEEAIYHAAESSRGTRQAPACLDACRYLGGMLRGLIDGAGKAEVLAADYHPAGGGRTDPDPAHFTDKRYEQTRIDPC